MQTPKAQTFYSAITVLLVSLPWLAFSYAGQRIAQLPHVPFDLFEWLTRALPGAIITTGLEAMISALFFLGIGPTSVVGKLLEMALAYLTALVGMTALGLLYAVTLGRFRIAWYKQGLIAGLTLWLISLPIAAWGGWGKPGILLGALWLLTISWLWGLALAWGVAHIPAILSPSLDVGRRSVLTQLAFTSLALGGLAVGLGRWLASEGEAEQLSSVRPDPPATPKPAPYLPGEQTGFASLDGVRPEITPIQDFYQVDINLQPPGPENFAEQTNDLAQKLRAQGGETELPSDDYVLIVDGLVEKTTVLTLEDVKAFPAVEQYATLACISNPVGGDLIGTTLFRGARLKDILDHAGLTADAVDIRFTCVDGYSESLPVESAMDPRTLLCYEMEGQPLSRGHGAPLRLYTPNRFGMKNPKWIIKIEAINEDYSGYWERQGWSAQAWIQTTSVIDAILTENSDQASPDSRRIRAGGIAFAGARGIAGVELRVDDGEWIAADIKQPLSPLTWVLWSATLTVLPGKHTLFVRAVDENLDFQTEKQSDSYPDGATGYHSKPIKIG